LTYLLGCLQSRASGSLSSVSARELLYQYYVLHDKPFEAAQVMGELALMPRPPPGSGHGVRISLDDRISYLVKAVNCAKSAGSGGGMGGGGGAGVYGGGGMGGGMGGMGGGGGMLALPGPALQSWAGMSTLLKAWRDLLDIGLIQQAMLRALQKRLQVGKKVGWWARAQGSSRVQQ
jgi:hypothetical protein